MGSDAMKTGISIWKGLISSITNCCGAIRDHLFVLGTMFLLFLLYRFVPALFGFLVSSLPLLVCTAVLLKTLLSLGDDRIKNAREEENRMRKISFQKERSVRKIRGAKSKYVDEDVMIEDKPKNNWNHSDKIMDAESSTSRSYPTGSSFYDDLVVNNNRKLEKMNLLLDSEPSQAALLFPIDDVAALERSHEFKVESGDLEAESQEEAEDEDEEGKGGQEDGTKVLAWTEDDQKNLMDLGTSEIERNKRLENLIAKRRARKILRLQAVKNLIELDSNDPPGQIAPISMVKGNPFDLPKNFNETKDLLLPSPGSAPSILLPTRNPFDLPYDSLEERPNLMGDSFQQEFMAEQKDISFCRHESFSFGPSLLGELKQDGHRAKLIPDFVTDQILSNRTAYPTFQKQSDRVFHEKLIEQRSYEEGATISSQASEKVNDMKETEEDKKENGNKIESRLVNTIEVDLIPGLVEEEFEQLSSPATSEVSEQTSNVKNHEVSENPEPTMHDFTQVSCNSMQISIIDSHPRSGITMEEAEDDKAEDPVYDSSPSAIEKTTIQESLFYEDKGVVLSSSISIASDLQVEVSEIESPSSSVERTIFLADGESSSYEESIKTEVTAANEETWSATSNVSAIDDDELISREITGMSEKDILEFGFSEINQNSDDTTASAVKLQSTVEQDPVDLIAPMPLAADSQEDSPSGLNTETPVEVQQVDVEAMVIPLASTSSNELKHDEVTLLEQEKARDMMEDSMVEQSSAVEVKSLQEVSYPPGKSIEEANIIYNAKELATVSENGEESLKSTEDNNDECQISSKHLAAVADLLKLAEGRDNLKLFEDVEEESEKLTVQEALVPARKNDNKEFIHQTDGNYNLEVTEDVEDKSGCLIDHDTSKLTKENHTWELIKGIGGIPEKLTEYEASIPGMENDNLTEGREVESEKLSEDKALKPACEVGSGKLTKQEASKPAGENDNAEFLAEYESESEKLTEHEARKPAEENDSLAFTVNVEGSSEKLTVHEESKPLQEIGDSDFDEGSERKSNKLNEDKASKKKEESYSTDIIEDIEGKSAELSDQDKRTAAGENNNSASVVYIEGESRRLTEHQASKPAEENDNEDSEIKSEKFTGSAEKLTAHEEPKPEQENNDTDLGKYTESKSNDLVEYEASKKKEENDCSDFVEDIEGKSAQLSDRDESKAAAENDNSALVEDVEGKPIKFIEHKASNPAQENGNSQFVEHDTETNPKK